MVTIKELPTDFQGCGEELSEDNCQLWARNGEFWLRDGSMWRCGWWRSNESFPWCTYQNDPTLSYFFCTKCLRRAGVLW